MDREQALAELSAAHALALRMRDAGAGKELIALALEIPVEGVAMLLEVAQAKLAALWPEAPSDGGR